MKSTSIFTALFFLGIFSFIAVAGCKKKTVSYKIVGKAIDDTFKKPLEDATIRIEGLVSSTGSYTLISNTFTDAEGNFEFVLPRGNYSSIRFTAEKQMYYENSTVLNVSDLNPEKDNNVEVLTTARSWIKIVFVNDNGTSTDRLSFRKQQGKINCEGCCDSEFQIFDGAIGGTVICANDGNSTFSYLYSTNGNSPVTNSTMTTPYDTNLVEIHY
ncbi:MAG: carboxypeptidase-like regulatory domain-containing protein [Bacteroidetes bacterium]|nr:carboxypeptidase-like regulatory domain-containing protein [Bacteroidota bacterium]